jgi:hypothetical protein
MNSQNSGASRRENAEVCLVIVARMSETTCGSAAVPHIASLMRATGYQRHCEERSDEAIQLFACGSWIASLALAMTVLDDWLFEI